MTHSFSNKKYVLLFFMSLEPAGYPKKKITERYTDYFAALNRLLQLRVDNFAEILICENTVGLRNNTKLADLASKFPYSTSTNSGVKNKGIGELSMAVQAKKDFASLFQDAEKVIWMSGRHIPTSHVIFEEAFSFKEDALVSNPDFFYLDGSITETAKEGLINDMFFSMKKDYFFEYLEYFLRNAEEMENLKIGSEQLLFSFITSKDLNVRVLPTLGLLRREYKSRFKKLEKSVWHVC